MPTSRLVVPIDRIPSVNELYLPNLKTGEFFKNPEVKHLMDKMVTYIADNYKLRDFSWIKDTEVLTTDYDFVLKKGFYRRDVSNMIKMVEDSIMRYFQKDDRYVMKLSARKSLRQGATKEYIVVTISSDVDMGGPPLVRNQYPLVIPLKHFPSINDMYGINTEAGVEFKKGYVHDAEFFVKKFIQSNIDIQKYKFINNDNWFRCNYDFFLNAGNGMQRDVSNLIKFTEDAIFRAMGVDDSRVVQFQARKYPIMSTDFEYVSFTINTMDIRGKDDLQIFK